MYSEKTLKWRKKLNVALNVGIVITTVILISVLGKKSFFEGSVPQQPPEVKIGRRIVLSGMPAQQSPKTLFLFLYSGCPYCSNDVDFYQRLVKEANGRDDAKIVVVMPEDDNNSTRFLEQLFSPTSIKINYVTTGVTTTPTAILTDAEGVITDIWKGELSPQKEASVAKALGFTNLKMPEDFYIDEKALKQMLDKKELTVVDVREREEYAHEHFNNAINIPIDELSVRAINELPQFNTIVVYSSYIDSSKAELAEVILDNQEYKDVFILRRNISPTDKP